MKPQIFISLFCLGTSLTSCQKTEPESPEKPKPAPEFKTVYTSSFEQNTFNWGGELLIDVNKDKVADFKITGERQVTDAGDEHRFILQPLNGSEVVAERGSLMDYPENKEVKAEVENGRAWTGESQVLANQVIISIGSFYTGKFTAEQPQFLPLRIKSQGKFHYGWMKLQLMRTQAAKEIYKYQIHAAAVHQSPEAGVPAGKFE